MKKVFYMACIFVVLTGCSIKTPEIHGVVLDAETKQPVEGAWVTATLGIKTRTIGGDSHSYLSVDPPHTRTDKNGKFVIPSRSFKKPSFPMGFGTTVETFGAGANTADDKGGSLDLKEVLRKKRADITIYIEPEDRTESDYFSHLQALYNYCLTGRFAVEVPPVKGGCDDWELDYVIAKHERYLERYRGILEERGYSSAMDQLADLYERKGNFKMAIETFQKSMDLMKQHGFLRFEVWQKNKAEIERKINVLKQKLKDQK